MQTEAKVELFHGLKAGGIRHCEAVLRGLDGRDEALIEGLATPAETVGALIASTVRRIGAVAPVTRQLAAQLTVGDRERLVLALAIMMMGDRVELVARCPSPACHALADVPLRLGDFLRVSGVAGDSASVELDGPGGTWKVGVRPPLGRDQEQAARAGPDAARQLSIGCVTGLIDPLGRQAAPEELPVELEPGLAASLLAFDPAAEWLSCMPCPSCGAEMDVLLDALTLLRTALAGALWRDVYAMASAYHWSEAEILALPVTRRKRYLAIAASMVAGA